MNGVLHFPAMRRKIVLTGARLQTQATIYIAVHQLIYAKTRRV
jgi:hypothetical protein